MITTGDRVVLAGNNRSYFVRAGSGRFSTDLGTIDLDALVGLEPGTTIETHSGTVFWVRIPRPTDFFLHAKRSGAPMLPKEIGLVIGYTGMNRRDTVLDAGTGSGIAAVYFGGIAEKVVTCEHRPDFARIAGDNIRDAGLDNVELVQGDMLNATGLFDIVHLDMMISREHIVHAAGMLRPGGYLACYTPFLEQLFLVMDVASGLFPEIHAHEAIGREMTRTGRGTRPSTSICHSGYLTVARR